MRNLSDLQREIIFAILSTVVEILPALVVSYTIDGSSWKGPHSQVILCISSPILKSFVLSCVMWFYLSLSTYVYDVAEDPFDRFVNSIIQFMNAGDKFCYSFYLLNKDIAEGIASRSTEIRPINRSNIDNNLSGGSGMLRSGSQATNSAGYGQINMNAHQGSRRNFFNECLFMLCGEFKSLLYMILNWILGAVLFFEQTYLLDFGESKAKDVCEAIRKSIQKYKEKVELFRAKANEFDGTLTKFRQIIKIVAEIGDAVKYLGFEIYNASRRTASYQFRRDASIFSIVCFKFQLETERYYEASRDILSEKDHRLKDMKEMFVFATVPFTLSAERVNKTVEDFCQNITLHARCGRAS